MIQAFLCNLLRSKSGCSGKRKHELSNSSSTRIPIWFWFCADIGETAGRRGDNTAARDCSTTPSWSSLSISLPLQTSHTRFHMEPRPKCSRSASWKSCSRKPTSSIRRSTGNAGPCCNRISFLVGRAFLHDLHGKSIVKMPTQILEKTPKKVIKCASVPTNCSSNLNPSYHLFRLK